MYVIHQNIHRKMSLLPVRSGRQWLLIVLMMFNLARLHAQEPAAQPYQGTVGRTLATSKEWWPKQVRAPEGAPNIVWILLDDVGFGATSAFGGLVPTPTLDSLANNGLRYTNFHDAGICAPTRAALLTGRNHHFVTEGGFSHKNNSAGFPGWFGRIPSKDGTIAEVLRDYGYNTFAVGKYGLTPDEEASDAGPFDRWPTGKGFEHFYGFLESETDQYKPNLVEDNTHIKPDGRHLSAQITDKALFYIEKQKKAAPGKPFFLYYAPAATHTPHQVDSQWRYMYKGKFDEGWDVYREKTLARQIKMGLVPANATLPDRNENIPAWNTLSADEKKLYCRFMEVYAGYLTYSDHEIGRIVQYLKNIDQLNNTLFCIIIGDNGATKEGGFYGAISKNPIRNYEGDFFKENLAAIDLIGTPQGRRTCYPVGWSQATNTPFKYFKNDANAEGATHTPLIVFYPDKIKESGVRNQYGHVIDLLPTTLDFLHLQAPQYLRSVQQDSLQGISLYYTVGDKDAPSRHITQYYAIFGSRAIYNQGWKAGIFYHPTQMDFLRHQDSALAKKYDNDHWELYKLDDDFNERVDLAKKYPEKLKELQVLFDRQAAINNIYPLIGWDDLYQGKVHKNFND